MARHQPDSAALRTTPPPSVGSIESVSCNPALLELASARRVLLLQGPVGPFFDRLTRWLQSNGSTVNRVIFQAGDRRDCQCGVPIPYVGNAKQWPAFLGNTIRMLGIDVIALFGQARPLHAAAIELARSLGLTVVVMEEGYIRPGYVTMELDGVNGFSTTLRRFQWSPGLPGGSVQTSKPRSTEHQFRQMAWFACRHYWSMYWHRRISPHYQHHKSTSIWSHSFYWVLSLFRKQLHFRRDNSRVQSLVGQKYFFVPLQHDGDSQISHHSPYVQSTEFIIEVMMSFVQHAPEDALLVFRQHPHSRGGHGHDKFIHSLATELGVREKVMHLVEGHTPTLLNHALGVVVINSTVGLQALMRRKPLMVLGDALYDRPGLNFQGPLDQFWVAPAAPDPGQAREFLQALIALTQVPCNVYGLADEPLHWTLTERSPAPGVP